MKLFLEICILVMLFDNVFACTCFNNINASSSVVAVTISGPTESGGFGSLPCGPIDCTTTVIFEEPLINDMLPGAQVTFAQCSHLSQLNTLTINNETYNDCPEPLYSVFIRTTNLIKFRFFSQNESLNYITFVAVLQPIPQTPLITPSSLPFNSTQSFTSSQIPNTCSCYPDQNVSSSSTYGTIIQGPTINGVFGSQTCRLKKCSTTVTFNGLFSNNLPAGAKIIFLTCYGLTSDNTGNQLNVVTKLQNISIVCGTSTFDITYTNIFEFVFQIRRPPARNVWIIVEPIPQVLPSPSSTISTSSEHLISVTKPTLNTTNSFSTSLHSNLVGTTPTSKDTNDSSKWWIIGGIITFVFCILIIIIIITFFIKRRNGQKILEMLKTEMQGKFELSPLEKHLSRDIRSKMHLNHKNVRIDFDELIGRGSNACVYKAFIKGETCLHAIQKRFETSHFVDCEAAVKIPKTFDTDEIEEFVRELDALITINHHPHIIALFGWSMHQSIPCLITELADIDLLAYVRSLRNEDLPMTNLLSILWQITQALEFVASLLMVHRDVACRNILLINNHKMAKLGDFGLCCHCDESLTYKASLQKRFPLKWLSIEALLDRVFSEKSDVWSFGVLCYEVYSYGAVPYPALSNVEMLEFIQAGGRLEKPIKTPEGMYEIMIDCWNELPQKRPNFKELGQRLRKMLEEDSSADGYLKIVEI